MKKYYNNILYEMAAESAVLGGGGSGNVDHDINVSLEGFDSAKAAITSARTEIENAVTKAGTAINDAKGACDADIAAAIEEGISAPDLKNLNQAFAAHIILKRVDY